MSRLTHALRQFVRQHWRQLLTLLLLALGVRLLVPQLSGLSQSLGILKTMAWGLFGLAVLVRLAGQLCTGLIIRALAGLSGQRVSLALCALISAAASGVGLVAGGLVGVGASSYHWLREREVEPESALLAASLPPWLNNASIALMAVVGIGYMLMRGKLTALEFAGYVMGLALVLAVVLGVAWALSHREATTDAVHWCRSRWAALRHRTSERSGTAARVARVYVAWDALRAGAWREAVAGALLASVLDVVCLYLLFAAVHHPVSGWVLLTGYSLPMLASKVVAVPGGVGIVEAGMDALYRELGTPHDVSAVVVMAYRLLSFWLPTLIGFAALPYLNRGRARRAATPPA